MDPTRFKIVQLSNGVFGVYELKGRVLQPSTEQRKHLFKEIWVPITTDKISSKQEAEHIIEEYIKNKSIHETITEYYYDMNGNQISR